MIRPCLALLALALALGGGPARAEGTRMITGALTYLPRIALPAEAELVVTFRDEGGTAFAEMRRPTGGLQVPLPFRLAVPADRAGVVEGAVHADGTPLWTAPPVLVAAGTGPVALGEIVMTRAEAVPAPVAFDCGGTPVEVAFGADAASMRIGADEIALVPVPAASGARYEAKGDPGTFAWSRGDRALVGLRGTTLPECTAAGPATPPLPDALLGAEWRITAVEGVAVAEGEPTLAFLPEGRVAGTGGCNRFMGAVTVVGTALGFGPLASTMIACPEPRMAAEGRLFDALARVDTYRIADDGTLVLGGGTTDLVTARR